MIMISKKKSLKFARFKLKYHVTALALNWLTIRPLTRSYFYCRRLHISLACWQNAHEKTRLVHTEKSFADIFLFSFFIYFY